MLTPDPTRAAALSAPRSLAGALVADQCRLRCVIGRGGMGTVSEAENVAVGRTVAVEVLHAPLAARRAFDGRQRDLLLRTLTPELFFSLVSELWRRCFAMGEVRRGAHVGRGYGRLVVLGVADALLARSVAIAGYLGEALRRAGARDVDARLASAAALGDPMDALEATWSS